MELFRIGITFLLLQTGLIFVHGTATVFTNSGHRGQNMLLQVNGCVDLKWPFYKNVESINTHGGCVTLHDVKGCRGDHVEIKLSTPGHWNLKNLDFSNKATSIGPCENCTQILDKLQVPKTTAVTLYIDYSFKGRFYEMKNISGCVVIPRRLRNKVLSIRTDGNCYELHQNLDCTGQARELSKLTQRLFHDFRHLEFENRAAAISLCHYKCFNQAHQSIDQPVEPIQSTSLVTEKPLSHHRHEVSTEPIISPTSSSVTLTSTILITKLDGGNQSTSFISQSTTSATLSTIFSTESIMKDNSSMSRYDKTEGGLQSISPLNQIRPSGKSTTRASGIVWPWLLVAIVVLAIIVLVCIVSCCKSRSKKVKREVEEARVALLKNGSN